MSSESLYVVPRFWDADQVDYHNKGFEGWMIFGILGFFNFLYYSDMFINKYVMTASFNNGATTPYDSQLYGGVGSGFFSQLGFKSTFGIGQWVRVFLNWMGWFVVMMCWAGTLIPGYYSPDVWLFNLGAYFMGTLHLIRTSFLIIVWLLSIAIYNDYNNFYRVFDYFSLNDAMGSAMTNQYSDVTGHKAFATKKVWIDWELEMATCVGLFVGIPLLAPRYHAAKEKEEAQRVAIRNEYLNNERKWKTSTLQKIAIEEAKLKASEERAEKAEAEEGRSAIDIEEEDAEEAKEW